MEPGSYLVCGAELTGTLLRLGGKEPNLGARYEEQERRTIEDIVLQLLEWQKALMFLLQDLLEELQDDDNPGHGQPRLIGKPVERRFRSRRRFPRTSSGATRDPLSIRRKQDYRGQ